MGNQQYLIPANSKKSMLKLGLFNGPDLIIFGTGCAITFILMLSMRANDLKTALMILAPALICAFLVIPIPNQHNVRTLVANIYEFYSKNRKYYWRGWCNSFYEQNTRK